MSRVRFVVLAILGLISAGAALGAQSKGKCLDGLKPMLLAGGFTGSTDCGSDKLSVKRIGVVRAHGREFTVFDYRYQLAQICQECAIHGGQRIIFVRSGRYVGQYKPDMARVTIVRGTLVFSRNTGAGEPFTKPVTIKFTPRGPAKRVWFDGEILEFFR